MKFKTIQEAFNHYMTATSEEIEKRAADIKQEISTDPNADIEALNIELDGLREAKANNEDKGGREERQKLNPVTGMVFSGGEAVGDDVLASKEYRSAFLKKMLNRPLSGDEAAAIARAGQMLNAEKRDSFISTMEAAAVIPTQMLNEIYKKAADSGGILSVARRFDIPANLSVPVATPEDAAEWHAEGDEVAPGNEEPAKVTFSGFELMKVFSISAAARAMSLSAYESYLQEELGRVIVTALQKAAVTGTGSGQPLGLLADGVITSVLNGQPRAYSTFIKAAAMLRRGYGMGAMWAMNNATLYTGVMGITDSTEVPLFNEARDGGGPTAY